MLTPEQIAVLQDRALRLVDPVNQYLLDDVARRLKTAGQFTSSASYQIWRAEQLGMSRREVERELKKRLNVSRAELRKLLTQTAEVGYSFELGRLRVKAVPFAENEVLQQIVGAAAELADVDFRNVTKTLGMMDGRGRALPLRDAYRSMMDDTFYAVVTGTTDYNTAVRRSVRGLAEKGVLSIDYQSGVHTSLEAAVRRCTMGALGLMTEQIEQANHDTLGCNGWEITAHAGSAPDHEPYQGRQYRDAEYKALNDKLERRIGTLNCGHMAFPIIWGVNMPQYTKEELQAFREENERGVTYEGRHYTGYEATQMQRKLERSIRKQKRRVQLDTAAGDTERLTTDKIRLQRLNQEYRRFSKAAGLRTERERTWVHAGQGQAPVQESDIGDALRRAAKSFGNGEKVVGFDKLPQTYKDEFRAGLVKAAPEAKAILRREYRKADYTVVQGKRSYYRRTDNVIAIGESTAPSTLAHELFHKLDEGHKISAALTESLAQDYAALNVTSGGDIKRYLIQQYPEIFSRVSREGEPLMGEVYRGIADILNGLSGGEVYYGYGHSKKYWSRAGALEAEAWAQFGRISYENKTEVIELLNMLFPNFNRSAIIALKEWI